MFYQKDFTFLYQWHIELYHLSDIRSYVNTATTSSVTDMYIIATCHAYIRV